MVVQLPQQISAVYEVEGVHRPNLDDIDTAVFEAENQLRLLELLVDREYHRKRVVNVVVTAMLMVAIAAGMVAIFARINGSISASGFSLSTVSLVQVLASLGAVAASVYTLRTANDAQNIALIKLERDRLVRALEIAQAEVEQSKRDRGGLL